MGQLLYLVKGIGSVTTQLRLPKKQQITATPKRYLFAIAFGAGLPFFLLAANGLRLAPVADGASLIPGVLPPFRVIHCRFLLLRKNIQCPEGRY
ncbi:hypothetical protein [Photobacterium chitinilyticum]|uniref:hypothetical protein n=1 Tax=Photobacterium chitinilyticum TaxID=2485123 RepID=UPI001F1BCF14|nr:hypothetical protein [Photobacterium chitinilyticum]